MGEVRGRDDAHDFLLQPGRQILRASGGIDRDQPYVALADGEQGFSIRQPERIEEEAEPPAVVKVGEVFPVAERLRRRLQRDGRGEVPRLPRGDVIHVYIAGGLASHGGVGDQLAVGRPHQRGIAVGAELKGRGKRASVVGADVLQNRWQPLPTIIGPAGLAILQLLQVDHGQLGHRHPVRFHQINVPEILFRPFAGELAVGFALYLHQREVVAVGREIEVVDVIALGEQAELPARDIERHDQAAIRFRICIVVFLFETRPLVVRFIGAGEFKVDVAVPCRGMVVVRVRPRPGKILVDHEVERLAVRRPHRGHLRIKFARVNQQFAHLVRIGFPARGPQGERVPALAPDAQHIGGIERRPGSAGRGAGHAPPALGVGQPAAGQIQNALSLRGAEKQPAPVRRQGEAPGGQLEAGGDFIGGGRLGRRIGPQARQHRNAGKRNSTGIMAEVSKHEISGLCYKDAGPRPFPQPGLWLISPKAMTALGRICRVKRPGNPWPGDRRRSKS